ncbi:unnamed protein product [Rotaria sp. Silwood2]|nr:unnamed protein product [Rotaria sp. Silwood2]CAF2896444.1 unnamed protein product [Rotaria sp. Silwood2]CAF3203841.1 unnamed protein product [Rotaria sp. Silwood2]CAF3416976.1 unnamed protein product [Rotaria sp. Silwood2]CAF4494488.1 unnamed protein product [Rotaria sp. Silwood2]
MNNSIENLVKKLNILLDDCHQLIPLISLLNSPTSRSDVFMLFGIGYTHIAFSSEQASIAYICGSTYSTNSKYSIRLDHELKAIEEACQGAVIDTDIVSPNVFDFYLNSDAPIQGTAKPMLYQVLCNEIGFTSNEIQILT